MKAWQSVYPFFSVVKENKQVLNRWNVKSLLGIRNFLHLYVHIHIIHEVTEIYKNIWYGSRTKSFKVFKIENLLQLSYQFLSIFLLRDQSLLP